MSIWLYLMPREVELLSRPAGNGENAAFLRQIAAKVDHRGELTLTHGEFIRVGMAARNWQGGAEAQFKALLAAAERSN